LAAYQNIQSNEENVKRQKNFWWLSGRIKQIRL